VIPRGGGDQLGNPLPPSLRGRCRPTVALEGMTQQAGNSIPVAVYRQVALLRREREKSNLTQREVFSYAQSLGGVGRSPSFVPQALPFRAGDRSPNGEDVNSPVTSGCRFARRPGAGDVRRPARVNRTYQIRQAAVIGGDHGHAVRCAARCAKRRRFRAGLRDQHGSASARQGTLPQQSSTGSTSRSTLS
jgi:hypothetical protein